MLNGLKMNDLHLTYCFYLLIEIKQNLKIRPHTVLHILCLYICFNINNYSAVTCQSTVYVGHV